MAIVIEPAHQTFGAHPRHACRIQPAGDGGKERARVLGKKRVDLGRIRQKRLVARILGIEDAQRVLLQPLLRFFGELILHRTEIVDQSRPPRLAACAVAQRVEVQGYIRDAQLLQELVRHRQQLDIGLRLARADHLGVDLVELAVAPLLRALVAEQRAVGRDLERRKLLPAVGEESARDPGGELGAQGERISAAILEGIHFLRHHIGGLAERAGEDLGLFEHRHFHPAEAV